MCAIIGFCWLLPLTRLDSKFYRLRLLPLLPSICCNYRSLLVYSVSTLPLLLLEPASPFGAPTTWAALFLRHSSLSYPPSPSPPLQLLLSPLPASVIHLSSTRYESPWNCLLCLLLLQKPQGCARMSLVPYWAPILWEGMALGDFGHFSYITDYYVFHLWKKLTISMTLCLKFHYLLGLYFFFILIFA